MFSFDPYSPAVDADPFPYYKQLRDEAPCFWNPEAQMWILSRYADIVSAGQDWQTYSSASGNLMTELPGRAGATLGSSDPPKHDRLRGLIQSAFMKRNLLSLEEPIRAVAQQTFGQLKGEKQFDFKTIQCKHIDLIEVAVGDCSLKIYGGRLNSKRMQDLPIAPEQEILPEQREELRLYCLNDLDTTIDLFNALEGQLSIREQMEKIYQPQSSL